MYNLNANEILMVDGGGDGGKLGAVLGAAKKVGSWIGGNALWSTLTSNGNYSNNSGVGTGTNQSYGGYGQDTGGGMMQAGGSKGGHGR